MPHESPRSWLAAALAGLFAVGLQGAHAATPRWSYSASLSETVTDNSNAREDSDGGLKQITRASVGASASHKSGRVSSSLHLRAETRKYSSDSSSDTSFVLGSGQANAVLVDHRLFLDLSGSMNREFRSAFGPSSVDDSIDSSNRTIVRRYNAGLRAPLNFGDGIRGNTGLRMGWTSGGNVLSSRRITREFQASLGKPNAFGKIGWNLAYNRNELEGQGLRGDTQSQSINATLTYEYTEQVTLRAFGGRESNNYQDGRNTAYYNRGVGASWVLSPRTRVDADIQKRFFGTGYNLGIQHTRPRSNVSLRYAKDVSSFEQTAFLSLEEIAYLDFFASLAATIADPVQRDLVARSLAATVPNGSTTFVGFVTNSFSVSRTVTLTGSLIGVRNVLSVALNAGQSDRLGSTTGLSANDDFSSFSRIQTRSAIVSLSHKLSARSNLTASTSLNRSQGSGGSNQDVTRRSYTVGLNTRIGPHTTGALNLRSQRSDGNTAFEENALTATVNASF